MKANLKFYPLFIFVSSMLVSSILPSNVLPIGLIYLIDLYFDKWSVYTILFGMFVLLYLFHFLIINEKLSLKILLLSIVFHNISFTFYTVDCILENEGFNFGFIASFLPYALFSGMLYRKAIYKLRFFHES